MMWNTLPRAMQQVSPRTSFNKPYLELLTSKSQSANTLDLAINHLGYISIHIFSFFSFVVLLFLLLL